MEHRLVSADSHVNPPPTAWAAYLPSHLRERAPRVESTDDGDVQVFEGRRTPILGINSMAGKRPEEYSLTVRRLDDQRAGGHDPAARLADQDVDGVDAEVLFGFALASSDAELRHALVVAANDWMADFCSHAPSRLVGAAVVPVEDVDRAVAELRRAAGRGLKVALVPTFPPSGEWNDPVWEPLWRTVVDLGLPAAFHVRGRRGVSMPRTSAGGFMTDVTMSKFTMTEALAEVIFGGLLARWPDLRLVSVEAQIGWIPFALEYMDHIWAKHRWWTASELREPPSTYFHAQVSATFMEDPVGVANRHLIGVDNIMWSSDYPHSETTWPDSARLTAEWFADVPGPEAQRILAGNAVRVFGL